MTLKKRSLTIHGHRTSISLEDPFFEALQEIANLRTLSLQKLIEQIDETRELDAKRTNNLSSAIRIFVLAHYRK